MIIIFSQPDNSLHIVLPLYLNLVIIFIKQIFICFIEKTEKIEYRKYMKLHFTYTLVIKIIADFFNVLICINLIILESIYGTFIREKQGYIEFS